MANLVVIPQSATLGLLSKGAKAAVTLTTVDTPYTGDETLIGVPGMSTKTVTEMGGAAAIAAYVTANSDCDCTLVGTTLTLTSRAYGEDDNDTQISGTLLSASGRMANGADPITAGRAAAASDAAVAYASGWRPMRLISKWEPEEDSADHDFVITPGAWRELFIRAVDTDCAFVLRLDGSAVSVQFSGWNYSGNNSDNTNPWVIANTTPLQGLIHIDCRSASCWVVQQAGVGPNVPQDRKCYGITPPTTSVGVQAFPANTFKAGIAWVELWGVPYS